MFNDLVFFFFFKKNQKEEKMRNTRGHVVHFSWFWSHAFCASPKGPCTLILKSADLISNVGSQRSVAFF